MDLEDEPLEIVDRLDRPQDFASRFLNRLEVPADSCSVVYAMEGGGSVREGDQSPVVVPGMAFGGNDFEQEGQWKTNGVMDAVERNTLSDETSLREIRGRNSVAAADRETDFYPRVGSSDLGEGFSVGHPCIVDLYSEVCVRQISVEQLASINEHDDAEIIVGNGVWDSEYDAQRAFQSENGLHERQEAGFCGQGAFQHEGGGWKRLEPGYCRDTGKREGFVYADRYVEEGGFEYESEHGKDNVPEHHVVEIEALREPLWHQYELRSLRDAEIECNKVLIEGATGRIAMPADGEDDRETDFHHQVNSDFRGVSPIRFLTTVEDLNSEVDVHETPSLVVTEHPVLQYEHGGTEKTVGVLGLASENEPQTVYPADNGAEKENQNGRDCRHTLTRHEVGIRESLGAGNNIYADEHPEAGGLGYAAPHCCDHGPKSADIGMEVSRSSSERCDGLNSSRKGVIESNDELLVEATRGTALPADEEDDHEADFYQQCSLDLRKVSPVGAVNMAETYVQACIQETPFVVKEQLKHELDCIPRSTGAAPLASEAVVQQEFLSENNFGDGKQEGQIAGQAALDHKVRIWEQLVPINGLSTEKEELLEAVDRFMDEDGLEYLQRHNSEVHKPQCVTIGREALRLSSEHCGAGPGERIIESNKILGEESSRGIASPAHKENCRNAFHQQGSSDLIGPLQMVLYSMVGSPEIHVAEHGHDCAEGTIGHVAQAAEVELQSALMSENDVDGKKQVGEVCEQITLEPGAGVWEQFEPSTDMEMETQEVSNNTGMYTGGHHLEDVPRYDDCHMPDDADSEMDVLTSPSKDYNGLPSSKVAFESTRVLLGEAPTTEITIPIEGSKNHTTDFLHEDGPDLTRVSSIDPENMLEFDTQGCVHETAPSLTEQPTLQHEYGCPQSPGILSGTSECHQQMVSKSKRDLDNQTQEWNDCGQIESEHGIEVADQLEPTDCSENQEMIEPTDRYMKEGGLDYVPNCCNDHLVPLVGTEMEVSMPNSEHHGELQGEKELAINSNKEAIKEPTGGIVILANEEKNYEAFVHHLDSSDLGKGIEMDALRSNLDQSGQHHASREVAIDFSNEATKELTEGIVILAKEEENRETSFHQPATLDFKNGCPLSPPRAMELDTKVFICETPVATEQPVLQHEQMCGLQRVLGIAPSSSEKMVFLSENGLDNEKQQDEVCGLIASELKVEASNELESNKSTDMEKQETLFSADKYKEKDNLDYVAEDGNNYIWQSASVDMKALMSPEENFKKLQGSNEAMIGSNKALTVGESHLKILVAMESEDVKVPAEEGMHLGLCPSSVLKDEKGLVEENLGGCDSTPLIEGEVADEQVDHDGIEIEDDHHQLLSSQIPEKLNPYNNLVSVVSGEVVSANELKRDAGLHACQVKHLEENFRVLAKGKDVQVLSASRQAASSIQLNGESLGPLELVKPGKKVQMQQEEVMEMIVEGLKEQKAVDFGLGSELLVQDPRAANESRGLIGEHTSKGNIQITEQNSEVDNEVTRFLVGDLVWAKVKSHPWWPGQIFDPVHASPLARRFQKPGRVLVAFFGDRTFGWLQESQLIEFWSNFPNKVQQTSMKGFCSAVSEALDEVCRRVEVGLRCPCHQKQLHSASTFPDENTGIQEGVRIEEHRDISLAVENLKPEAVLEYVRGVASSPFIFWDRTLQGAEARGQVYAFRTATFGSTSSRNMQQDQTSAIHSVQSIASNLKRKFSNFEAVLGRSTESKEVDLEQGACYLQKDYSGKKLLSDQIEQPLKVFCRSTVQAKKALKPTAFLANKDEVNSHDRLKDFIKPRKIKKSVTTELVKGDRKAKRLQFSDTTGSLQHKSLEADVESEGDAETLLALAGYNVKLLNKFQKGIFLQGNRRQCRRLEADAVSSPVKTGKEENSVQEGKIGSAVRICRNTISTPSNDSVRIKSVSQQPRKLANDDTLLELKKALNDINRTSKKLKRTSGDPTLSSKDLKEAINSKKPFSSPLGMEGLYTENLDLQKKQPSPSPIFLQDRDDMNRLLKSLRMGECVQRVATELTGSPPITKCLDKTSWKKAFPDGHRKSLSTKVKIASDSVVIEDPNLESPVKESVRKKDTFSQVLQDLLGCARDPLNSGNVEKSSAVTDTFLKFRDVVFLKSPGYCASTLNPHLSLCDKADACHGNGNKINNAKRIGSKLQTCLLKDEVIDWADGSQTFASEEQKRKLNVQTESLVKRIKKSAALVPAISSSLPQASGTGRRARNRIIWGPGGNKKWNDSRLPASPVSESKNLTQLRDDCLPSQVPVALLMKFPGSFALPSEAQLKATFIRFGALETAGTRVYRNSGSAQVVFKNGCDAQVALKYAKENKLFGQASVHFRLRAFSSTQRSENVPISGKESFIRWADESKLPLVPKKEDRMEEASIKKDQEQLGHTCLPSGQMDRPVTGYIEGPPNLVQASENSGTSCLPQNFSSVSFKSDLVVGGDFKDQMIKLLQQVSLIVGSSSLVLEPS